MPRFHYERLSDRSANYLASETPRAFAHASSIQVFEAGPLAREDGGVDMAAIRRAIEAALHRLPRLRQELLWIPFEQHPVWVDDGNFNLAYHLRHTSLPKPGGFAQLEEMAARIMAQRLDRARPLWECWVLEGLEGGRFALLMKTHHCMIDEAGADLLEVLLSTNPETSEPEARSFTPRPPPSIRELMVEELLQQARLPRSALERLRRLAADPDQLARQLRAQATSAAELLGYTLRPAMDTPLNGLIGPHRRFKGISVALDDARAIRRALQGKMVDVILSTVAGALRGYLEQHLVSPSAVDFRVGTPVGLAAGRSGERMTEWIIELPVWEKDPVARFRQVREATRKQADSRSAVPARMLLDGETWFGSRLLSLGARTLESHTPVNMTVINAPGTQVPLFFEGARLLETYGQVPLRDDHGLGIAVMSYDGRLFFGLNADFDLVPDLDFFGEALERSFEELRRAAGAAQAPGPD
ncbi:MAG: wax ester/triacylglycerol synthase family O-acyltransferase [Deltaproteobacteria bacterium]|nr:wax ester/triacylglycerol synthase family O-acyltransferase [Deltaproteobacteria bacterium]